MTTPRFGQTKTANSLTQLYASGFIKTNGPQFFAIDCPHCGGKMNAAHIAKLIPAEVFAIEVASRNGKRQTRHPGPGRPTLVRCPGCDNKMQTADLREHRIPCLRDRLNNLKYRHVILFPKDPDPYPDFFLQRLNEDKAEFEKSSSGHCLSIELQKITEVVPNDQEQKTYIRVLVESRGARLIVAGSFFRAWQIAPLLCDRENGDDDERPVSPVSEPVGPYKMWSCMLEDYPKEDDASGTT